MTKNSTRATMFLMLVVAVAASTSISSQRLGPPLDLVERAADSQTSTQNEPAGLGGTSWQLVKFQGSDDTTLTPDDKTKYTITFGTDGRLTARIDCNRGMGTWKSSGPSQVEFGPLALTRVMCPPGSLLDQIAKNWPYVRSYTIKDGHLFLALMADGGIYEFEPISGRQSSEEKPLSLFGTKWRLTEVNETRVRTSKAYLEFDNKTKRFSGDGGCNRIAGGFQINGMRIKFSPGISTRRACIDNEMQRVETDLFKGLTKGTRFQIQGDTLRLYAGDRPVLTFKANET